MVRHGMKLEVIDQLDGFTNPRLKIRFELEPLRIFRPDGTPFLNLLEAEQRSNRLADKLRELGVGPNSVA
ncbi:MAG: hypothetical protein F6K19_36910 [Cyanothece sp. SIO1E1]|nr:hypothetical protein [Cyanothece sp. SIO1E1]